MDRKRLKRIRCLLLDVDGVLTDGKLHFTSNGEEFKTFDVQDGHGIAMALRAGLLVGFVTGRPSEATAKRAADLGVKILKQGPVNKMDFVDEIKREHNLRDEEIAFIGDELVDLPVLRRVGVAVAVPNAVTEVKRAAHFVTRRRGGDGAVREVIELLLKAQGSWKKAIAKYLALLLAGLLAGASVLHADSSLPGGFSGFIEKFEIPERDENGNLKWKLAGERAQIRNDGLMQITNAHAELYQSNAVALVFTTPSCLLDRGNSRATSDAPIRLERENMVVTGVGADWDGKTTSLIVRSNVRVVFKGSNPLLGEPKKQ